ncbi:protein kinase [Cellulomonas sp. zg-ZUI222]|uniref:non-specific serine/threonine protein kinase n=1 Tax=Cellulomonas wangleii TaxID=2816956 RepID=A0ABX8D4C9_9CELL|nr:MULTISPECIES: serine/threonine-protein kinase [Cellulomonas]MBO0899182.1 protein kinase [Cellulomonas sp. zg-ZUI22]MBO0920032.1 protein kinase [Cellulomonas wangleii]MBO0923539.1 protein kinase [Cellulomonas wangleii]QVI61876.1 protein kinase [Cellulomonas wangleii]
MTSATACREPGCTGTYEDGWCDLCGSPAPSGATSTVTGTTTPPAAGAPAAPTPSSMLGTGIAPGVPTPGAGDDGAAERSTRTGRTSSTRLASAALGSARTVATGSRATRRLGTSSTRLRRARLGAGLTTVPPAPVADPLQAVMADPQVPERKRFCAACGEPVGRGREGVPARTQGFCPSCGARFDFDPRLAPGTLVGGQYEVAGCLAHGGMGWIYLARDRNVSGRWVVLKGLLNSGDPDAVAAAISERQFLARVEHPLIVEIYNFVQHDGDGYTVMEFVGGRSLKELLTDRREAVGHVDPLPVDQALAFVLEVLPAFAYLHDLGLLYCDFKPDNVIQAGDALKLIDMGGVRRIDDDDSAIYGTVGYQAPEVPVDGPSVASDVYTIGRTLATLVLDFRGNTTTYVAALPPVDQTPVFARYDSFYRLLAKACAPDPSDRFGSVDEMRAQVLGVLREVVAADRGAGDPPLTSVASVLFEPPVTDHAERALAWDELPALKVDPDDPAAGWLAGVNVVDAEQRLAALAGAPEDTVEVRLLRATTAIEAGRPDVVTAAVEAILADDPWEWRAVWIQGLAQLATGDPVAARASFNAVYGQVPGELAPKLALAVACELSGEPGIAEQLYATCAYADANYTAPAAFGLARLRIASLHLDDALAALDLVTPTRSSYPQARLMRARILARSRDDLPALAAALESVRSVPLEPAERAALRVDVLSTALATVRRGATAPGVTLDGAPATQDGVTDALEAAYREQAGLTADHAARVALVDRANRVRRWTAW